MKLAIVGTRGIPAIYGGFEQFAQELSVRLQAAGIEVSVYCDRTDSPVAMYKGVKLYYSKYTKTQNPLGFYFDCIHKAIKHNDILLITSVGGSIFYPLLKRSGVQFITNIDGLEAKRSKWSALKQAYLSFAERAAIYFSDYIIADSGGIADYIRQKYAISSKQVIQIEYGAALNNKQNERVLERYEVQHNRYFLVVSRLEPENNVHLIIDGYLKSNTTLPLLIVGNIMGSPYVQKLIKEQHKNIRFVGGIYNREELDALRYSCKAYLHGHSVGGTNPSLLEAMGSGNVCICHDNVFNREVTASQHFYFEDSDGVSTAIHDVEKLNEVALAALKKQGQQRITDYYNWERISDKYKALILKLSGGNK